MPGIFPDIASGGVTIRDVNGVCLNPANVSNAYCPPETFITTCEMTALPNDCTARIIPAQINAFQSELVCLAQTMDPDGSWNCGGSLCNLATAFQNWITGTGPDNLSGLVQQAICTAPVAVFNPLQHTVIFCDNFGVVQKTESAALFSEDVLAAVVNALDNTADPAADAKFMYTDNAGNLHTATADEFACMCPPTPFAGVPSGIPTNNSWAMDTTNPSQPTLYFWDGTAWRVAAPASAVHELSGNQSVINSTPVAAPGAETTTGTNTFTISNSSAQGINVQAVLRTAGVLAAGNSQSAGIAGYLYDGPTIGGTLLAGSGAASIANNGTGGSISMTGNSVASTVLLIPPGGREVTLRLTRGPGLGAGGGNINNHNVVMTWHGIGASSFN